MTARRRLLRAFYRGTYVAGLPFRDGGITILSYHSIDANGTPLSVSPGLFAAQMATLAAEGCATFTMSQVAQHLGERKPFPPRAVAITFDDGFSSVAEIALPLMRRFGLKATVYVITGMVGRTTRWTDGGKPLPSLRILGWDQIEQLHGAGVEIGAHTATHGFLTQYADAELTDELDAPREVLRARLGAPVSAFAYPQGDYDRRVVNAVRATGYSTATTVDQGRVRLNDDPFLLPRLLVSNNTTPAVLRAFTVPSIGPAYRLINLVIRGFMGRKQWPRRKPGEVDSTGSVPISEAGL
ncbi:MAG: polysaccharide deacetylase family protein [Chloroflexota bacterium]